jgi:hypothetical protein
MEQSNTARYSGIIFKHLKSAMSAVSWQYSKSMNTLKGLGHEIKFKFILQNNKSLPTSPFSTFLELEATAW